MQLPQIAVFPQAEFDRNARFWNGLADLYEISFIGADRASLQKCEAAILVGVSPDEARQQRNTFRRILAFIGDGSQPQAVSATVTLGTDTRLHPLFRNRKLSEPKLRSTVKLVPQNDDKILARCDEGVLWTRDEVGQLDLVAAAAPQISNDGYIFPHLTEGWISLLPILEFCAEVSGARRRQHQTYRACFMFDDPNLHWKSYGFIPYARLAQEAEQHNYHVSFATVPADSWFVHQPTAGLFREHRDRLSFLVHGNNHVRKELARTYSDEGRYSLVTQALGRIEKLEKRSGLKVARVMAAPHGACSEAMASVLSRMDFDAACISRGSIMAHNKHKSWPVTVGLRPSEHLDSLPIIPRFGLGKTTEIELLFVAYLGQPVVMVGHHEDVADGLEILRDSARLVNSFGAVQWCDMSGIADSHFSVRQTGDELHVKIWSRRVRVKIPDGIRQLIVHRPWLGNQAREVLECRDIATGKTSKFETSIVPVNVASVVQIRSLHVENSTPQLRRVGGLPVWALTRRLLCEGRDRLKPIYS